MSKKIRSLNHFLIGILILVQPFVNMFQSMVVRDVQLFGLSVFEGFNILLSLICFCFTVYTYKQKNHFLKYIPYVVVLGAYAIAHGLHIYSFNNDIYPSQSPSFFVELYYIFRTFLVPLLLMFNIYYSEIGKEKIIKILETMVFIISSVIVVTNVCGVALRNYLEYSAVNKIAVKRIFDWFTFHNSSKYSYYEITTKGWFYSANQISAILFISFLIIVYRAYKKRDWLHYLMLIMQMLAMCMLGTKVANLGCYLIVAVFVIMWIVFALLKHNKKSITVILTVFLAFLILLPFTPIGYKYRFEMSGDYTTSAEDQGLMLSQALEFDMADVEDQDEDIQRYYEELKKDSAIFTKLDAASLTEEEKIFVQEYMITYGSYFGIDPYIVTNYDDLQHSEFWVRYLQETPNNDYRVLKNMILKDIYVKNNNSMDKYLGMGYTLNYIYTESDYTYQMYSYGLIGLLVLVGPYFAVLLYVVWQGLCNFKKMFTLECASYFIPGLIGLAVAKMSGHVLERLFPLLTIAIACGIVAIHTREVIKNKGEIM